MSTKIIGFFLLTGALIVAACSSKDNESKPSVNNDAPKTEENTPAAPRG